MKSKEQHKKRKFLKKLLNKYRFTILNENKQEENAHRFSIRPLSVLMSLLFSFMLVVAVLYLIVVYTPVGTDKQQHTHRFTYPGGCKAGQIHCEHKSNNDGRNYS